MLAQPDNTLRKVHLYGHLAEGIGDCIELAVRTPVEAVRLLELNFPGFAARFKHGRYHVCAGEAAERDLDAARLDVGFSGDLHLMPRPFGRSRGKGLLTAVLGGLIIGAAFFLSGGALATALPGIFGATGATFGTLATMGTGLVLSGIGTMLTPTPETDYGEKQRSFVFNGPVNVTDQGGAMPVVFGKMMVGTIVLSASIDSMVHMDDTAPPSPGYTVASPTIHIPGWRTGDPVSIDLDDLIRLSNPDSAQARLKLKSIDGTAVSQTANDTGTQTKGILSITWVQRNEGALSVRFSGAVPVDGVKVAVPLVVAVDGTDKPLTLYVTGGNWAEPPPPGGGLRGPYDGGD